MFVVEKIDLPKIGLRGLEAGLSEEESAIQDSAHRFAEEVMRPIAEKLDKMTPDEVVAEGSPIWDYLTQLRASGLLDLEMLASMSNDEKSRIVPILFEELALIFTGVARAAYDHALAYCHERVQGGVPIIEHQSVRLRLFALWRKVEACRAMAHRICNYNYSDNGPHVVASITSKTFVTQNAFEVTSEALQLFGGNGLTREYPIEKLMRDARASMIEDGENNILGLNAMGMLSDAYKFENNL